MTSHSAVGVKTKAVVLFGFPAFNLNRVRKSGHKTTYRAYRKLYLCQDVARLVVFVTGVDKAFSYRDWKYEQVSKRHELDEKNRRDDIGPRAWRLSWPALTCRHTPTSVASQFFLETTIVRSRNIFAQDSGFSHDDSDVPEISLVCRYASGFGCFSVVHHLHGSKRFINNLFVISFIH